MVEAVRKGTAMPDDGTIGPDNPIWVTFARAMAALMDLPSQLMAKTRRSERGSQIEDSRHRRRAWSLRHRVRKEQSARGDHRARLESRPR